MNQSSQCFVCSSRIGVTQRNATNIFSEQAPSGETVVKVLSEVLEKSITKDGVYSNVICKKCYKSCIEYDTVKVKLKALKTELLDQFKKTLPKHNLTYATFNSEATNSPNKTPEVSNKKLGGKIVLPASKLQPVPADYVINVGQLGSALNSNFKMGLSTITTTVQKPQALPVNIRSTNQMDSAITAARTKTSQSDNQTLNFTVNSLPKDFMSSTVTANCEKVGDIKKEGNNEDDTMEIDEDYEIVKVDSAGSYTKLNEDTVKNKDSNSKYIDISLLPLSESENILGKLVLDHREDEDDDEEETIVMTGENGDILRVMSGQRLVYENGEISLVQDEDSGQECEERDADSNDESQIELQVSGDEETANAIIAAAQEQGGAFIKVESGEMYRVKSIKSKSPAETSDANAMKIVADEDGVFKCLLCVDADNEATQSGDAEEMMAHLRAEHDARAYICRVCRAVVRRHHDYTRHLQEHGLKARRLSATGDKSKVHECNICNKKYNSRVLLAEHLNKHSGARPHACAVCHKAFASKYTHQAHLKTHLERPRPFKCSQCPKSFLTQPNLNQHEKTHSGVKDFVCNVCGKRFGSQHNLEVHGVVHSGERPFVCGVCGKAFARRAEVRDHMRTHTGERPFECEVCGATFAQRSNLHSHRRATHLDDRRYHCDQCPKKFKRRRLLEYHIKGSHTGERPLQCNICRATFVYPEHYKKHKRIHSGERPYDCEVCGKTFNSRDNRNTHRFVHSDKKPYECLVCGAGYMRKQLLYAHMNTSGHLAESIVVNQPRVQKVNTAAVQLNNDKLETIFEPSAEMQINIGEDKSADTTKTINIVPESEDQPYLTLHNVESGGKDPAASILHSLQGITAEQLSGQPQMVGSDENGEMVRLVQIQLEDGNTGWVAINQ